MSHDPLLILCWNSIGSLPLPMNEEAGEGTERIAGSVQVPLTHYSVREGQAMVSRLARQCENSNGGQRKVRAASGLSGTHYIYFLHILYF